MIAVTCPSCRRTLSIKDAYAGKTGICPHCKGRVKVPVAVADDRTGNSSAPDEATLAPDDNIPSLPAAPRDRLDFLAPPQGPGEIGRLGGYRVLKVLGAGGMGMVLQAEDPMLKRIVALKVMRPELAAAADARERFLREAQATAAIEHPHIIHVYQVGEDRGVPFLAMPFLKGEPLDERLKRQPRLPVAESVSLGRQIAEGLAAAHAAGLIHRDIKPGNIWLEHSPSSSHPSHPSHPSHGTDRADETDRTASFRVKILDFGLARASTGDDVHLTKTGAILGTPAYMAPEQAKGETPDHRCDLFSLGGVLYRMLTGQQPFKGVDTISLLMALATEEPTPVRELNPAVPPALADLVMRLLAKDPARRPTSAQAVAAELAAIIGDRTEILHPGVWHSASGVGKSWARWLLLVAGGAVALFGVIVLALAFLPRRTRDKDISSPDAPQTAVVPDPAGTIVNSLGMKLVPIQAGKLWMGSPKGEQGHRPDEIEHIVYITKPFYMGMHEVTVGQFKEFVKQTGRLTDAERTGEGGLHRGEDGKWIHDKKINWHNPGFEQTDDHPVVCVSWNDAWAFCSWLSEKDGKQYVVPTEAQWEYCCRAGTRTRYAFGDDDKELENYAWMAGNSGQTTHPVGRKMPNAWGLFDMHGNTAEWISDTYDKNYYMNSPREDPRCYNGRQPLGVLRGGDWSRTAGECRSAFRNGALARLKSANAAGFRVAMLPHLTIASPATGMALREIAPGRFPMGSPGGEPGRGKDEQLHDVGISKPFWIGRYEVTVNQFQAFVNESHHQTEAETTHEGANKLFPDGVWKLDPAITWRNPGFMQTGEDPVVCVSWNDAAKFCEWLSKKEGKHFALPTEAQWEYCCRAGARTRFSSGNDAKALALDGWFDANAEKKTHPVAQKRPNRWGLYDMHGNAWEWCADWYAPAYAKGPGPIVDPRGPAEGTERVVRGGSWHSNAPNCRPARRAHNPPSDRNTQIGFRVVRLPESVLTNSIGMKLKLMPAGTFTMGSPGNEPWRGKEESQHEVVITRPFYLGVYKVTVGQFKAFVAETNYKTEAERSSRGAFGPGKDGKWATDPKRNWHEPGFPQTDEHPVVAVSWRDAIAFCEWLSKKEGRHYILPTEAQWEFACRAGSNTRFFFGNDEKLLDQYAWHRGNSGMTTHPVGQKTPNRWGLHDMYGNACEVMIDWYNVNYYGNSPREDPPGPHEGDHIVRRGGGWQHLGRDCRSARRESRTPAYRGVDQGFRILLVW